MKAMILCAGLGTRLRPWTLRHPKALVPVGGIPMLERVASRLKEMGFDEITLNVHHFADQIVEYVNSGSLPLQNVNISDETDLLLDTGGGILQAEKFLARDETSFLVHNVDILSNADLKSFYDTHVKSGNDITLLVSDRVSERKLVIDENMMLKGWMNNATGRTRPSDLRIGNGDKELSFSGIYAMSPRVFAKMKAHGFSGVFPVMDFFLSGFSDVRIGAVSQPGLRLIDIGKPETLQQADSLLL